DGNLESTLDAIRVWAGSTEAGDRAELPALADDSPEWRDVSPTQETRLGQRCKYFERCYVTQARRRAYAADVVIVNHHLFFADLALREKWPDVQLLPPYEAVIFDEAHQLEDVATDYFGVGVSSLRLMAIVRDVTRAVKQGNAPDKLTSTIAHVDLRAEQMFDALRRRIKGERARRGARRARGGDGRRARRRDDRRRRRGRRAQAARARDPRRPGAARRRRAEVRPQARLLGRGARAHGPVARVAGRHQRDLPREAARQRRGVGVHLGDADGGGQLRVRARAARARVGDGGAAGVA